LFGGGVHGCISSNKAIKCVSFYSIYPQLSQRIIALQQREKAMTNPDYQRLARDFMDMWQKQMGSVVRDKQFIQAMLDMTKNWQNPYASAQKPAYPHAADADDAKLGDLAQLAFRIGMCEQRLLALEAAAKPKSAGKRKAKPSGARRGKKPRK
jgi:hypothetical protein